LTRQQLEDLLVFLDSDREVAASKHEVTRNKLITFFQSRGCFAPEEYTDITMYRVAKRINEGLRINTDEPTRFIFGVARRVLQEYWNDLAGKAIPLDHPSTLKHISQDPFELEEQQLQALRLEQRLECLDKCLKEIRYKDQVLILRYYQGETCEKIENRKSLAGQFGLSINALRIRALRIREKLEACVKKCAERLTIPEMKI
jgi:DNA-directed RNA polymerase specialized sigma24 family protein